MEIVLKFFGKIFFRHKSNQNKYEGEYKMNGKFSRMCTNIDTFNSLFFLHNPPLFPENSRKKNSQGKSHCNNIFGKSLLACHIDYYALEKFLILNIYKKIYPT